MPDLTYEFARKHVEHYASQDQELIQAHHEAMDCYDCEAFLQLGIDAFQWLMRADFVIREAIYDEVYAHDPEADKAIMLLCRTWLKPCESALSWAKRHEDGGYQITNIDEFRKCCAEMKAIVEALDEVGDLPQPVAELAEQAIQEFKDGETTEFF